MVNLALSICESRRDAPENMYLIGFTRICIPSVPVVTALLFGTQRVKNLFKAKCLEN